jgi:hypothetical protein
LQVEEEYVGKGFRGTRKVSRPTGPSSESSKNLSVALGHANTGARPGSRTHRALFDEEHPASQTIERPRSERRSREAGRDKNSTAGYSRPASRPESRPDSQARQARQEAVRVPGVGEVEGEGVEEGAGAGAGAGAGVGAGAGAAESLGSALRDYLGNNNVARTRQTLIEQQREAAAAAEAEALEVSGAPYSLDSRDGGGVVSPGPPRDPPLLVERDDGTLTPAQEGDYITLAQHRTRVEELTRSMTRYFQGKLEEVRGHVRHRDVAEELQHHVRAALKEREAEFTARYLELQGQYMQLLNEKDQMRGLSQALRDTKTEADAAVRDLKNVVASLERDNAVLKANVERHADKAGAVVKLTQELTQYKVQCAALTNALKQAEKVANGESQEDKLALAAKESELAAMKAELDGALAECSSLEGQVLDLKVMLRAAEEALAKKKAGPAAGSSSGKGGKGAGAGAGGRRVKAGASEPSDELDEEARINAEVLERARMLESANALEMEKMKGQLAVLREAVGKARAENLKRLGRHTVLKKSFDTMHASLTDSVMIDETFLVDLTCRKCLKLFHSPESLPCGHTFCATCISSMAMNREYVFCSECQLAVESERREASALEHLALRFNARQLGMQGLIESLFDMKAVVDSLKIMEADAVPKVDVGDQAAEGKGEKK